MLHELYMFYLVTYALHESCMANISHRVVTTYPAMVLRLAWQQASCMLVIVLLAGDRPNTSLTGIKLVTSLFISEL